MDFSKILKKKHVDKWVAISTDGKEVIGFDSDLKKLDKRIGARKVSYIRVLPNDVVFAPLS